MLLHFLALFSVINSAALPTAFRKACLYRNPILAAVVQPINERKELALTIYDGIGASEPPGADDV